MNFDDFTITKREIVISISIILILLAIGFFISGAISNNINENNEKYYKALKINNNEEQFKYALKTNIGYTLAKGKIQAVNGVQIKDIEGTYYEIRKVKEEYTMHTRQVAHTRKVGNRTETYYTTEIYYTWDFAGQEEFKTEKFSFLGEVFDYQTIRFYNERYIDTIKVDSDTRYKYYAKPFEFEGTLFTYINNNTINENNFNVNTDIETIIKNKQDEELIFETIFWIVWIILIGLAVIGFVYLENKWLED